MNNVIGINSPENAQSNAAPVMRREMRMTPQELRQRTKIFAIEVIRFCRSLPKTDESRVISWQLLRCGPAVGANYRATCRCRSDKDFIAKLGIVIEEADET